MCDHEQNFDESTFNELIGGVPYMLGFYPQDCLLVLPYIQLEQALFCCAIREEISNLISGAIQPDQLADVLRSRNWDSAVLMVIGGGTHADGGVPPHSGRLAELDKALWYEGIQIQFSFWVPRIKQGERWIRYCEETPQFGVQKDPRVCSTAVRAVSRGKVIYDCFEEFADTLKPGKDANRRSRRLHSALLQPNSDNEKIRGGMELSRSLRDVNQAVHAAENDEYPRKDKDLVLLAHALGDSLIWSSSLRFAFTEHRQAAIRLWRHLTRELSGGYRANAAVLLAVTAGVDCNTELVKLALNIAAEEDPVRAAEVELIEGMPYGVLPAVGLTSLSCQAAMAAAEIALIMADTTN
ncbi:MULTISPECIES: DUF4192 domain-containing protein [unclassified Crossiella]|uniref:DUF4192 domain-containing protein n=1 Tax=unclassified Crossiella TaxID=2620835 RepID=UPI0020001C32|nr:MULTISPECIES: DUF4192 domain-containing protein [unclassified Crossiella]MCK2240894.1 DUF4192 domain-containing protein [Crossiella sp. S99.2]MCK2253962.1 DUF4192 domain-containing protein [Crossiella sp. S99.1]